MEKEKKIIKRLITFFIAGLFFSGLTAIPVEKEVSFFLKMFEDNPTISSWLKKVYEGIHNTYQQYPFLAYGYDWLAFAHFVLAILFLGPLKDPVKNKWVIQFGIITSILILPFALIAGSFRGIPIWWRLIDCSFGIVGILILGICLKKIKELEILSQKNLNT